MILIAWHFGCRTNYCGEQHGCKELQGAYHISATFNQIARLLAPTITSISSAGTRSMQELEFFWLRLAYVPIKKTFS